MPVSRRVRFGVRTVSAVALVVVALLGTVVVSPAAQADSVATAQARVDALQQLARDTTDKLLVGTRAWEADQAQLASLELDLHNTERRIASTQALVDAQQAQVNAVVRNLYMRPAAGTMQLAVSHGPDAIVEALQARQALDIAAGTQSQVIARAVTARHRLRTEEQSASQLVTEAQKLTKASARRLAALNALADTTASQLSAAQDALSQALAERAAAQAAARDRAAKARAARARALTRDTGGASCQSSSTAGQANGNLDPSSLCPLWMAPGHRLRTDAAKAFDAMSQFHASDVGSPLCITDSYRTYSEQVSVYHRKPGLAAVPGTSNHGWGLAVDFCGGIEDSSSAAYDWMTANAGRFSFQHPDWAQPGGSKPEAWHWEYVG